jgi:hypothetical protein
MEGFERCSWVFLIAVTLGNGLVWWRRSRVHIAQNPDLARGYKRLILGFVLWGNLPWFVMGLGLMTGGVDSVKEYLRPRGANPWVLALYGTGACIWALCLWWIFVRDGAQAIVDHPGLFNFPLTKSKYVKLLACATILACIVPMVVMFRNGPVVPYWTSQADGYTTIFTVYDGFWRVAGTALGFLAIGIVVLVIAVTWIRSLRREKQWNSKEGFKPGFLLVWSIIWILGGGSAFSVNLWRSYALVRAYRDGAAQVVEGTVQVISRQPEGGHARGDLIRIGEVRFGVDYFSLTPAYSQTIAHGGALRDGVQARVWHCDGLILRADIRR